MQILVSQPKKIKSTKSAHALKAVTGSGNRSVDLEDLLGQRAVVLFSDLALIRGSLEYGRVVIDVLHVDHHCRVVLAQVVGGCEPELVLQGKGWLRGRAQYTGRERQKKRP